MGLKEWRIASGDFRGAAVPIRQAVVPSSI
jgi:hypothetical protein